MERQKIKTQVIQQSQLLYKRNTPNLHGVKKPYKNNTKLSNKLTFILKQYRKLQKRYAV